MYGHNIYKHQQYHHSNSSKGEDIPHYDKHHIQHPSIIHTSLSIHNKLFIKDFHGKSYSKIILNQVRLIFYNFKTTKKIEPKLRKQLNCLNYVYT